MFTHGDRTAIRTRPRWVLVGLSLSFFGWATTDLPLAEANPAAAPVAVSGSPWKARPTARPRALGQLEPCSVEQRFEAQERAAIAAAGPRGGTRPLGAFSRPELLRRGAGPHGDGVTFLGTSRGVAKSSIADAAVEEMTLVRLLNQFEPDDEMVHRHPPIPEGPDADRVAEERRNVAVEAYLHFAKKEADNDYHVIIGTSENPARGRRMNVEISGLPRSDSPHHRALKDARAAFEGVYGPVGRSHYTQYEPRRVRVTGSLLFNTDHQGGTVGPKGHQCDSAWEIHPVTRIEYAD